MTASPIAFTWTGDSFEPLPGFAKLCDREFVIGQRYQLVEHQDRSSATHRHYFACINAAWENLPEHLAHQLPTPEHLRKYALIKAGFADCRTLVAASRAEALRLAAFMGPLDGYAVITTDERTVTVWTARSQSARAMPKGQFRDSKDKVLAILAEMIGTDPATLAANASIAA